MGKIVKKVKTDEKPFDINSIKTGDTFLTTDYSSFISWCIRGVMKKFAKKNNIDSSIVLSHSGRFVWIANELYVYGSVDSGYKPWLFNNHYSLNDSNEGVIIMRRKIPLTKEEENKTINYCQYLVTVSIGYQYWNFIQWLAFVYLNIDLFKKDGDQFTYCFESELMCRRNLNPEKYGDTYQTDFFRLLNDINYEIVYKNIKE